MKNFSAFFAYVTLACFLVQTTAWSAPRVIYSVKTKLPTTIPALESLPSYYKGHSINLREGRAELPECGESQTFSVIFTQNIGFAAKGNTVRYLKLITGEPYLWYDLTLSFRTEKHDDEEKRIYSWSVEKRNADDVPERVPEHALVVITNPDFIETLKPEISIPGAVDIVLPTIVFKDSIDPQELQESVMQAIIGPALDLDAIHSKNVPACLAQPGSAVITTIAQRAL